MKQKERIALLNRMNYVELQEVVTNGSRLVKQPGMLKAERSEILKNIAWANEIMKRYKDVRTDLSGNFN